VDDAIICVAWVCLYLYNEAPAGYIC
jgi:hypothetical protein